MAKLNPTDLFDVRSLLTEEEQMIQDTVARFVDERALPHLKDLDVWIVDALQYREHPSHFSLAQSLAWIETLQPRRAILTHMHTPLDYQTVMDETPDHVTPAHDGMVITI